jgi:hypothetical protein
MEMNEQLRLKQMRHTYSVQGWALLVYYGIMNVAVMLVMFMDAIVQSVSIALSSQEPDMEQMTESMMENSAWGYFVAIAAGLLVLLLWKKPKFCFQTIWKQGKPLTIGSFAGIFVIFVSVQLLVQVTVYLLEFIFNQFGLSLMGLLESASGGSDSLGMFLYAGFGAPIAGIAHGDMHEPHIRHPGGDAGNRSCQDGLRRYGI